MGLYTSRKFTDAFLLLNSDSGIVADFLLQTGQLIKNGGFTGIGIADEGNVDLLAHTPGLSSIRFISILRAMERLMAIWDPLTLI